MSEITMQTVKHVSHVIQQDQSCHIDTMTQDAFLSIDTFESLLSKSNHDHVTDEIVRALGGIDKILNEYIRMTRKHENEELLDGLKMQTIADVISATPAAPAQSIYDKLYKNANLTDNTFHLSSSDTIWHSMFGNTADHIVRILFSKCMMTIVGVALLIAFAPFLPIPHEYTIYSLSVGALGLLLLLFTLMILSCNVPALLLILTTFDFWGKLLYSIIAGISLTILLQHVGHSGMRLTYYELSAVAVVFLIINLSLFEGYHGNWKFSFIFGFIISSITSFMAIGFTFGPSLHLFKLPPRSEFELWSGVSVELVTLIGHCFRVLSLFLWRQTLMAAYTRGECCICIYLSPYIKWIDHGI